MGYYTTVFVDVRIPQDKIEAFHKEVNRIKDAINRAEKYGEECLDEWFNYYWDISINDGGYIEFEEAHRKWYEEEKFYDWLLQFNPQGSIILIGESLDGAVVVFKDGKWAVYDIYEGVRCLEKHGDEFKAMMSS